MPDLLVRLYALAPLDPVLDRTHAEGFELRRALAAEKHTVIPWIANQFAGSWASETEIAFARQPVACFLAFRERLLCGFAAYEATCRGFFGPIGVHPDHRSRHVGEALLLTALHAMSAEGYAYAIIGGAGPIEFFQKTAGATVIENSTPGIYPGL
ncbi:MAG: GNAT family N-acetyltransferase [Verrucomicrobiales bacterium]